MEKSRIIEEENLYEHFTFKADAGQKPLRVDKFLINNCLIEVKNSIKYLTKEYEKNPNKRLIRSFKSSLYYLKDIYLCDSYLKNEL